MPQPEEAPWTANTICSSFCPTVRLSGMNVCGRRTRHVKDWTSSTARQGIAVSQSTYVLTRSWRARVRRKRSLLDGYSAGQRFPGHLKSGPESVDIVSLIHLIVRAAVRVLGSELGQPTVARRKKPMKARTRGRASKKKLDKPAKTPIHN